MEGGRVEGWGGWSVEGGRCTLLMCGCFSTSVVSEPFIRGDGVFRCVAALAAGVRGDRGRSANGIGRAQGVAVVLASRRAGRVDDEFACFDCS